MNGRRHSVHRAPQVVLAAALVVGAGFHDPSRDALAGARGTPMAVVAGLPAELRIGAARGDGFVVTSQPIEHYVARVLAGEALRGSAPAALEALAVTIRTYAFANLGRHHAQGFDLCDQTHCQVPRAATAATSDAAAATVGQILLHDGQPAEVFYSASCGGRTEVPSAVWPGARDPSHLPSRADDACQRTPAWTSTLGERDVQRALIAHGFRGTLRRIRVDRRSPSGRVLSLRLEGMEPGSVSGQEFRMAVGRTLGWQLVKSTAFDLKPDEGAYRFSGHGSGHGVGLCVIGSANLAARGESPAAILARYFPGLAVGVTAPDDEHVPVNRR